MAVSRPGDTPSQRPPRTPHAWTQPVVARPHSAHQPSSASRGGAPEQLLKPEGLSGGSRSPKGSLTPPQPTPLRLMPGRGAVLVESLCEL